MFCFDGDLGMMVDNDLEKLGLMVDMMDDGNRWVCVSDKRGLVRADGMNNPMVLWRIGRRSGESGWMF